MCLTPDRLRCCRLFIVSLHAEFSGRTNKKLNKEERTEDVLENPGTLAMRRVRTIVRHFMMSQSSAKSKDRGFWHPLTAQDCAPSFPNEAPNSQGQHCAHVNSTFKVGQRVILASKICIPNLAGLNRSKPTLVIAGAHKDAPSPAFVAFFRIPPRRTHRRGRFESGARTTPFAERCERRGVLPPVMRCFMGSRRRRFSSRRLSPRSSSAGKCSE